MLSTPSCAVLLGGVKASCPFGSATHHLRVAVESCQVQWCAPIFVSMVGGCPILHQGPHHGQVALQASPAEGCQALLVHQRNGGTWKDKWQLTCKLYETTNQYKLSTQ